MGRINASKDGFVASGAGATTIIAGPGYLHSITISTTTSGALQTATFYDSLAGSGDILIKASIYYLYQNPKQLDYNTHPLYFTTGLTIDPGNCNVHVTVRAA